MDGKESPRKCPKCGASLLSQAKFCTQCGTRLVDSIAPTPGHKEPEIEPQTVQKPTIELDVVHPATTPSQLDTTLDYGLKLVSSVKENISNVIVLLGAVVILVAMAIVVVMLIPREFVSDIEVPPIEGTFFDLFVFLGLVTLLVKELTVFLGYIPKKETLDRWFSLVITIIWWTNLITLSMGLVETSLFFQIGFDVQTIFIILSLINFLIGLLYFWRYLEPLFSITFIVIIMSIVYLLQWIIPIVPIDYTILIFLTTFGVVIVSRHAKDTTIFIGLTVLLPLMFLSPYLLSNSNVIAILSLLISLPFIQTFLQYLLIKAPEKTNLTIKTLGELCGTLGMINVGFSVFYGYIPPELSVFLLSVPVIGFIILKVIYPNFQGTPLRDLTISVLLVFNLVFFEFIVINQLVLFGVALLLIAFSIFTSLEYIAIQQQNIHYYAESLLLISLVVVSLTNILFFWKICLLIIPLLTIMVLTLQKKPIDQRTAREFIFGSEILFLVAFLRTPAFDWIVIPVFSIIVLGGVFTLFISYDTNEKTTYSLDLTIFTLIFEVTLLVIMLWTKNSLEMLYPVFLLLILAFIISFTQTLKKLHVNFIWLNSTFIVCFGLMAYWNEFDAYLTVLVSFLMMLPILIEAFLSKDDQKDTTNQVVYRNRNLSISLSAIGLALIVFFEELDPISHGLLYLLIPIAWMALFLFEKSNYNALSVLSIILFPGFVFIFELGLKQTIFTPITEKPYLYLTLLALAVPIVVLQADQYRKQLQTLINPFVIGTALFSLILLVSFEIYEFQPEESMLLVFGLVIAIIVSILTIKWQYESVLLLIISFFPSTLYASYIDIPSSLGVHIIPIFPILLNFLMALKYMRTDLSVKLHEFLMLFYIGLFILFSPIKLIEYTTALIIAFNISWLFLGIIQGKTNQNTLILTNLMNSIFVLILVFFIEPPVSESYINEFGINIPLRTTLIFLVLVMISLVTILHLVSWQLTKIDPKDSYLMTLILVFNSSSFVLLLIPILFIMTDGLYFVILGILVVSAILLLFSISLYMRVTRLNQDITLACIYTTAVWVILSSLYFPNIELVFLWIFFAPLLMIVFLIKQEKTIVLLGAVFYFVAGLRLIDYTLEFLFSGIADWISILGLIIFGIELVSLGIYISISSKRSNNKNELVLEL